MDTEADTLAKQTGFTQRQRKLTGSTFAKSLLTTVLDTPLPTYADWLQNAAQHGVSISPQALAQRCTPQAAQLMEALLQRFVAQSITCSVPDSAPLLERFEGVYIKDSTVITLPKALASVWQGLGNQMGSTAALKLQVRWHYSTGQLDGPTLQHARQHDRHTPYGIDDLPAGSLELADLGYFCLEELAAKQAQGQYFVRRLKARVRVFTPEGEPLDLLEWLSHVGVCGEREVLLGQAARVPVRLIAFRMSEACANRQRQRLYEYACKKGGTPSRQVLALADWVLLVTNVPCTLASAHEVGVLARVRWQIEIVFRVWKSVLAIDAWRSRHPWRVLCEVYAKLLGVVLLHWLVVLARGRVWDLSLHQAARALQKVCGLLVWWMVGRCRLEAVVEAFRRCWSGCRVCRRRRRPATFQLVQGEEGLN